LNKKKNSREFMLLPSSSNLPIVRTDPLAVDRNSQKREAEAKAILPEPWSVKKCSFLSVSSPVASWSRYDAGQHDAGRPDDENDQEDGASEVLSV
jgi:hypothetical protein